MRSYRLTPLWKLLAAIMPDGLAYAAAHRVIRYTLPEGATRKQTVALKVGEVLVAWRKRGL